jgi:hypothetical protein
MLRDASPLSPEIWIRDVFACKAVQQGLVVRRKLRDIERYAGLEAFLAEVRLRGFRAVENRGQILVFCNQAPIRQLV